MIDVALVFLRKYIEKKFQAIIGAPEVLIADVPKDASDIDRDRIYLTLINIEEEKVFKNLPTYQSVLPDTSLRLMNPELRLNIYLLVSAIFKKDSNDGYYERQLKYLSMVIGFFQGKYVFEDVDFAALQFGENLEKIIVEMQTTNFDQNQQIWSSLGSKMSPCVLYKVRLVIILDKSAEPVTTTNKVTGVGFDVKMKS